MIISAWWLRTSSILTRKKSKKQPENSEMDNSEAREDSFKIHHNRRFLMTGG